MTEKLKILVVDDSQFMRNTITDILNTDPGLNVLSSARDGQEGLELIKKLHPDVVTMDIDMPVMDGLTCIKHIMLEAPVPIIVLSSFFTEGAITFEALRLGVVDFVPKPGGAAGSLESTRQHIIDRVKIAHTVNLENIHRVRLLDEWRGKDRLADIYRYRPLDYIVILGTNLSGPNTVIRFISHLSPAIPAAVIVQQEISKKIISSFAKKFDEMVAWKVEVARDDTVLEQGVCYIGSNENSLSIQTRGDRPCLKVGPPARQPLDLLFSSAAEIFRDNTIGVLLTGLGEDGANGFEKIKKASGVTIAQHDKCCVYPNLTAHAINRGVVDMVLDDIKLHGAVELAMDQT